MGILVDCKTYLNRVRWIVEEPLRIHYATGTISSYLSVGGEGRLGISTCDNCILFRGRLSIRYLVDSTNG